MLTGEQRLQTEAIAAIENGNLEKLEAIFADDSARVSLRAQVQGDGCSILHLAICARRNDMLLSTLERSFVNVDQKNQNGDTALHTAVSLSNTAAASLLISHGASIDLLNGSGMNPLHAAIANSIQDDTLIFAIVPHYLSGNVGIDVTTSGGWTALHLAVEVGMVAVASYLIRSGANIEAQSLSSHGYTSSDGIPGVISRRKLSGELGGWRPLHVAALKGDYMMVRMLLEHSALAFAKDGNGLSSIEKAAAGNYSSIIKLLLFGSSDAPLVAVPAPVAPVRPLQPTKHQSEDPKSSKRRRFKNPFNISKNTNLSLSNQPLTQTATLLVPQLVSYPDAINALHASIQYGDIDTVKMLLPYSLVNYVSPITKLTPISTAALHARVNIIRLLLSGGANPVLANPSGSTAIEIAACHKDPRVFEELEHFSGQIQDELRSSGRSKLLLGAVATGSVETVERLIKRDLLTNNSVWPYKCAKDDALWVSIATNKLEMTETILQLGWPCHFVHVEEAIRMGDSDLVNLVCTMNDALLGKKDASDRNAFHICAENGTGHLFRLLIGLWRGTGDVTVPLTTTDRHGSTPFIIAVSNGNVQIAEQILELVPGERWRPLEITGSSSADKKSVLACAFWPGHLDTILMLLKDANYTSYTATMLVNAMIDDNKLSKHALPVTRVILECCPTVTAGGQLNNSYDEILLTAASYGDMGLIALLLPSLTSTIGRHQVGQALVAAAWSGHDEVLRYIWNDNHDIRSMPCANEALYLAATEGHTSVVRSLLAASNTFTDDSPFTTDQLKNALQAAASADYSGAARAIFEMTSLSDENGALVLHSAVKENNEKLLTGLLALGINAHLQNADGWGPLHYAVICGHKQVAKVLLDHGVGINSMSGDNSAAIHQAAIHDNAPMVTFLLDNGANPTASDELGNLPIHLAAKFGCTNVMDKLCSHESAKSGMLDTKNQAGKTPMDLALENPSDALRPLLYRKAQIVNGVRPSLLHVKCREGDIEKVRLLLQHGAEVDAKDSAQETALHHAVIHNQAAVIKVLIENKRTDLEALQCDGFTPLATALKHQYIAAATLLVDAGADIHTKKHFQEWQPIHDSARYNRLESLKYLAQAGANIKSKTSAGLNSLHLAASGGHVSVVQFLLDRGVPIDDVDDAQKTALIWAIEKQHLDVVKLLLASGAEINYSSKRAWLPLHLAAKNDMTELVEILIGAGADINQEDSCQQETPLHYAAQAGKASNVQLLLASGSNPKVQSKQLHMPLHVAANNGHTTTAEILLKVHSDVDARTSLGRTPLMMAAHSQHGDFVRLMISKGANLHAKDNDGNNALLLASCHKGNSVLGSDALLELGADVNVKNSQGHTPLTFALLHAKRADLVKLYFSKGADANTEVNRDGGFKQPAIF